MNLSSYIYDFLQFFIWVGIIIGFCFLIIFVYWLYTKIKRQKFRCIVFVPIFIVLISGLVFASTNFTPDRTISGLQQEIKHLYGVEITELKCEEIICKSITDYNSYGYLIMIDNHKAVNQGMYRVENQTLHLYKKVADHEYQEIFTFSK